MGAPIQTVRLDAQALEARTQAIGRELFHLAKREHEHLTSVNRWTREVLKWCLADPQLKTQVLRFIDCLPSLQSPRAVARHLREYLPTHQLRLPSALRLGVSLSRPGLLTAAAASLVIHELVEQVARQFIAGARIDDAIAVLQRLGARRAMVSFDLLGEQVVSEHEADQQAIRYLTLIRQLSEAGQQPEVVRVVPKVSSSVHVSVKPSSLAARLDPLSLGESVERAFSRLLPIAKVAADAGAAITLDMEQAELRELTLALAKRLLTTPVIGERIQLGIVIQAYLRDSEEVTMRLIEWLEAQRRTLSIRLVKGAYWDHEVAQATQRGWTIPVYLEKWETDSAFERLTTHLLTASPTVQTAIASHNIRSLAHAMASAEMLGLSKAQLEFQLLYGMGDAIQGAISQLGYPVRIYTPVGELIPGMAYLVRRLLENTANESFLRQDFLGTTPIESLLQAPEEIRDNLSITSEAVEQPGAR